MSLFTSLVAMVGCTWLSQIRDPQAWFTNEPVVSTSFADADGPANLPDGFDAGAHYQALASLPRTPTGAFVLRPGFFTMYAESYCLHAGTHGPSRGDGYLRAPLLGADAEIIRALLRSARSRGDIRQSDVQMLVWAIESRSSLVDFSPRLRHAAEVLLSPEDRLKIEGNVLSRVSPAILDLALRQLPPPLRRIYEAQARIRNLFSSTRATYDEVRQLAVLPALEGGSPLPRGRWSKHPDGISIRFLPDGYSRTRVDVFVPPPRQATTGAPSLVPVAYQLAPQDSPAPLTLDLSSDVAVPANTNSQRLGFSGAPVASSGSPPSEPGQPPPEDCSAYAKNIGTGSTTESWFDRYGMPILLPNSYWTNENTLDYDLDLDKRLWLVAQAFIESNTSFPRDNNIWNLQREVKECTDPKQIVKAIEYICKDPARRTQHLPPGWPPSKVNKNGETLWACEVRVCRPSFDTPVDAVNGYMAFVQQKFKALFDVLNDPKSTLDDFTRAAAAFGSHPSYSPPLLRAKLVDAFRKLAAYLAARIALYDASLACYARMGDDAPASFVESLKDQRAGLKQMVDAIKALAP